MSLDVKLYGPVETVECRCSECDHVHTQERRECYFDANITHNLVRMAGEAGIYDCVWLPKEHGLTQTKARHVVEPLRAGIERMKADPQRFEQFDAPNGWGTYAAFLPWLERYLEACEANPDATVYVSR